MSTGVEISKLNEWAEKLAEKPFMQLLDGEKNQLKSDYLRIEKLVKGYVAGNPELVETFNKLKVTLEEQEGFFWENV